MKQEETSDSFDMKEHEGTNQMPMSSTVNRKNFHVIRILDPWKMFGLGFTLGATVMGSLVYMVTRKSKKS